MILHNELGLRKGEAPFVMERLRLLGYAASPDAHDFFCIQDFDAERVAGHYSELASCDLLLCFH